MSLSLTLIRCALGFEGLYFSDQGLDCNWTLQDGGKGYKGFKEGARMGRPAQPCTSFGSSLGSQVTFSSQGKGYQSMTKGNSHLNRLNSSQGNETKQIQTGKWNKTQIKPMIKSHSALPQGFYFLQIRTTLILHAYSPASFVFMTWLCYLEVLCQHFNQANSFADDANIYHTVYAVNNDYYLKINHTKHNCQ